MKKIQSLIITSAWVLRGSTLQQFETEQSQLSIRIPAPWDIPTTSGSNQLPPDCTSNNYPLSGGTFFATSPEPDTIYPTILTCFTYLSI